MPWKQSSEEQQREELVRAILRDRETVRAICRRSGISRQTAYKYLRRFLQEGRPGLKIRRRGRRPKRVGQWNEYARLILRRRRRQPSWGAAKLHWWLRRQRPRCRLPSIRTVERWLQSAGLAVAPKRRPPQWRPRASRVHRSNQVWTFDWKGWFRTGEGTIIEPLTIRDLGSRFLLWTLPVNSRSDQAVRRVCRRLFRAYGIPKIIRTDRGGPFCKAGPYGLSTLSLWWYRLGIEVQFVSRRDGIDNNAHEQMHRVLKQQTASPPARTWQAQLLRLRRWQRHYNQERPHAALGQKTPRQCYRPKPGPMPALLKPTYPCSWEVRTVRCNGDIWLHGRRYYISRVFTGLLVGCRRLADGYQVYYHRLALTTLTRSSQ